jgi:hypothetical protein
MFGFGSVLYGLGLLAVSFVAPKKKYISSESSGLEELEDSESNDISEEDRSLS